MENLIKYGWFGGTPIFGNPHLESKQQKSWFNSIWMNVSPITFAIAFNFSWKKKVSVVILFPICYTKPNWCRTSTALQPPIRHHQSENLRARSPRGKQQSKYWQLANTKVSCKCPRQPTHKHVIYLYFPLRFPNFPFAKITLLRVIPTLKGRKKWGTPLC